MKKLLPFLTLFGTFFAYSQEISGIIKDNTGETLYGVTVDNNQGSKVRSDMEGNFTIEAPSYPVTLSFSLFDFHPLELKFDSAPKGAISVVMKPETQELEGIVVSASRREQKIEEVSVSLEIIKPELIENKGITTIEKAVNQSPGAYTMDGQVSIRGGSGFSYGAGSRVMVVWNDAPLLSADAGDVKWESIALENISQIEILKGASSVLYGSGALNGIVSLRDKEPTKEGEIKASYQIGIYDKAPREGLRWSDKALLTHQLNVFHGKMINQFGYTISAYGLITDGYRAGENGKRVRLNGSLFFKPKQVPRMKIGLNYSFTLEKKGSFFVWENSEYGYHPMGGLEDPYSPESTITVLRTFRAMVDPYITYFDKFDNKHSLQTRFYNTSNHSLGENNHSAFGNIIYADYKFERKFQYGWTMVAGANGNWGFIRSALYGNHKSQNYAIYGQVDKSFGPVDLTAGMRMEYYQANDLVPDSRMYLKDSTVAFPMRPIFRAGAHWKAAEFTHLRASIGQAYRYPSIAERFASTSVGALNIFPNADLNAERGWSAELGIKQGFKIKNFKGFVDVSGFINEYRNMIEFTFGFFKPDSIPLNIGNPEHPGYVGKWYGFRAENAEHARIVGAELSINGTGNIGPVEITALLGYTYMHPTMVKPDSAYIYGAQGNGGVSNPDINILKYRFRHLAKGDIQIKYWNFVLGFGARYNSFMVNIDRIFEEGVSILGGFQTIQILDGLKDYRQRHNKGDFVMDIRLGYEINKNLQVHFIVDNLLNREYVTRPGDIQPPRMFTLRFQASF